MDISVSRISKNDAATIGTFVYDGKSFVSLELPETFEGQFNVPNKTCILPGTYPVVRLWSNHWNQMMPHVLNTPGRSEVEIHVANFPHDILGCMGIGRTKVSEIEIGQSRDAFEEFNTDFDNAISAGEAVTISIS
jgi:uncharacterized protein DUF5675